MNTVSTTWLDEVRWNDQGLVTAVAQSPTAHREAETAKAHRG